eukprot:GGOE01001616.1.p1 GENE.GGOE01001616.1~~GGOE01001616.1.p1  ORF type:complete len:536 (+),score=108.24 GGOE01001616.1:52-1659(+)
MATDERFLSAASGAPAGVGCRAAAQRTALRCRRCAVLFSGTLAFTLLALPCLAGRPVSNLWGSKPVLSAQRLEVGSLLASRELGADAAHLIPHTNSGGTRPDENPTWASYTSWVDSSAALCHKLAPVLLLLSAAILFLCSSPRQPSWCLAAARGDGKTPYYPRRAQPPLADSAQQLEKSNQHPRDRTVRTDPKKRALEYLAPSGQWVKASSSVTTFVNSLFPAFDEDKVIDMMMASPNWPPEKYINPETQEPYNRREIKQLWRNKGKDSISRGTYMHLNIEKDLNGAPADLDLPELQQFRALQTGVLEQRGIKPVRTEMSIYDEDLDLAGVVDFLGQDQSGAFHLCEWKRAVDYEKKATEVFMGTASALWPVEHLPNNDAVKHTLQLNLYSWILERKYGLRVAGLWIGVLHADRPAPLAAQAPFLQREMECLAALRRLDVLAAWRMGKPVSLSHQEALSLLVGREEPAVAAFQEALDTMKASHPHFYRVEDDRQRHTALVNSAQSFLRIHLPRIIEQVSIDAPAAMMEDNNTAGG